MQPGSPEWNYFGKLFEPGWIGRHALIGSADAARSREIPFPVLVAANFLNMIGVAVCGIDCFYAKGKDIVPTSAFNGQRRFF